LVDSVLQKEILVVAAIFTTNQLVFILYLEHWFSVVATLGSKISLKSAPQLKKCDLKIAIFSYRDFKTQVIFDEVFSKMKIAFKVVLF